MAFAVALRWLMAALTLVGSQLPAAAVQRETPYGSSGCIGLPRDLSELHVAEAIASLPNLSTLSSGLGALAAELNSAPQVTVFAPANEAFAKLTGPVTLDPMILKYHVVPLRIGPDHLVGTHRTLHGGELSVMRGPGHVWVNATAGLICHRVQTANGNVYLIDGLLTPR